MNRKRLLLGGVLTLAIVIATTSVSWSRPVIPDGSAPGGGAPITAGLAGPAGPQRFSPVASYYTRAKYEGYQLSQFQTISARLPAGRYLVEVISPGAVDAADCLGVAFPLVPPHDSNPAYTGYVTVARSGDEVAVSCFEEPPDPTASVSYELYFFPVSG
jgi:hypothetical protein